VITAARHPPGESHGLSGVLGTQSAGRVGAHHVSRLSAAPGRPASRFPRRSPLLTPMLS
jgi:hypothetical protein